MKNFPFPIRSITLFLLLSACQNPAQEEAPVIGLAASMSVAQPVYQYPLANPPGYDDVAEWGRLPEGPEREKAREASKRLALPGMQAGVNLFAGFRKEAASASVETALAHLERELATFDEPQRFMAGQMLAIRLLDEYLADGALWRTPPEALARRTLDADTQAVVAFATEQLTAHDSPNAHLMAATLQTLHGYWPEATIRAHAQKALAAAEAYLARRTCDTCSPAKTTPTGPVADQIRSGIDALKPLTQ